MVRVGVLLAAEAGDVAAAAIFPLAPPPAWSSS
jgi:hypothetical protein